MKYKIFTLTLFMLLLSSCGYKISLYPEKIGNLSFGIIPEDPEPPVTEVKLQAPTTVSSGDFQYKFTINLAGGGEEEFDSFRYTLTGIDPAHCNDGLMASSLTDIQILPQTTVLKAISCDKSGNPSDVMTRTYTFTGGWELLIRTTTPGQSLDINMIDANNLTVAWGDGNTNNYTFTGNGTASHTYATAGDYTLKISGGVGSIRFNTATGRDRLVRILTPIQGISGLTTFADTFNGCLNLEGPLPEDLFRYVRGIKSFFYTFYQTSSLTGSIPNGFFAEQTEATDFIRTFGFTGLSGEIPSDLLVNNTLVINVSGLFFNATHFTGSIPPGLFANNREISGFMNVFRGASGLTGSIPENLFANNYKAETFMYAFRDARGLTGSIPHNLFSNNPLVTSFFATFRDATGLTGSIPSGLFIGNPLVTNFADTFRDAVGLSGSIPPDLFDNNLLVEDFYNTFRGLSGLTGNAPELWNFGYTYLQTSFNCFDGAINLDNFASIPAGWK